MRRPVRSTSRAAPFTWPFGQAWRPSLAGLLSASLALPVNAAPAVEVVEASVEVDAPPDAVSRQDEARRLFRAAKDLYGARRYAEAAATFEASYAAAESREAAYNAALAHDKAGDSLKTMAWLGRYLADPRSKADSSHPTALKRVEELRARLGELRLQIDSPDPVLGVLLNGEPVALAEFPRLVSPGRIQVRLIGDAPGKVADIPAEVSAGGTWTIHFTGFAREEQQRVAPAPRPEPEPPPKLQTPDPELARRSRALGGLAWTAVGLTAVSAITTGVFAGLMLRRRDAWQARLCGDHVCSDQYVEAAADQRAFYSHRSTTNVMVGVTAGLAAITLALGIVALRARQRARAPSTRLSVTFAGLQLAF